MRIVHFADLHLGVETYGKVDPETGLSSRLQDFCRVFDELVDYCLGNDVDLVLFCGDAYRTREPTQTQQREFARRINRLASSGIPVLLLNGNHDLPNTRGRATATEIFATLALKNVHVVWRRPETCRITTKSGLIQVTAIPWLRRDGFLTREETKNLSTEEITRKMEEKIGEVIAARAAELDPSLPAVLCAHVAVSGIQVGRSSETYMSLGQEPTVLLSNIAHPAYDYVALGHIHKHQVLHENPPVVYAGSLERIDFGEENEEKGFCVVDISPDGQGKRITSFQFHPVHARRFLTIEVNLDTDKDPTAHILSILTTWQDRIKDAIVRLIISMPASLEGKLNDREIRDALRDAHSFIIPPPNIHREARLRLGNPSALNTLTHLDALKVWLDIQQLAAGEKKDLLEYGQKLIQSLEESD